MSTSQTRPRTPPSDYGPSLTPPTLEEINLCHVSIDVEASENKPKGSPPSATEDNVVTSAETEEANDNNNNSGTSNDVDLCCSLIVHL
ncbi:3256_t:CDS:1, partial [Paraglomus occultum]